MYLNMTTIKVAPENREKFIAAMTTFPENNGDLFEGCKRHYLLEAADEPGLFTSVIVFPSANAMKEAFGSPQYGALIQNELMPLMIAKPTRAGFNVVQEMESIDRVATWVFKA